MASNLSNRLRLEALEDRWNLSPLDPSAAARPEPVRDPLPMEQFAMNYTKVELNVSGPKTRGIGAGLVAPSAGPVPAAFDAFLEIKGIDGESTADKHKGQIEIESWSWGATS